MKTKTKVVSFLAVLVLLVGVIFGTASCTPTNTTNTTDYGTAINDLGTQLAKAQKDITDINASIAKLPDTIAVGDAVTTVTGPLSTRLSNVEAALTDVKNQLLTLTNQEHDDQLNIAKLLTLDSEITTLSKAVTDMQATVTAIATDDTAIKADIAALKTQVAALTPTTPTTTTTGTVTASLVGNVFTGNTVMSYNAFTQAGSASQSFSYKINNNTGKTLTGVQLALGLESIDANGLPVNYPADVTVTLASSNLAFVWTSQSTGLAYLLGWTNNTSTGGFLGQIGAFSQAPGTATYTVTVTITTTAATSAINLLPVIQVISFTTQS